jgi:uridine kinase
LAIILRGLPGSGKSRFAKLMRDFEKEGGAESMPRILCLDDYFEGDEG